MGCCEPKVVVVVFENFIRNLESVDRSVLLVNEEEGLAWKEWEQRSSFWRNDVSQLFP